MLRMMEPDGASGPPIRTGRAPRRRVPTDDTGASG